MVEKATLYKGNIVAITLRPNSAPLRSYVGEVQSVDQYGVRITLIDYVIGKAVGFDVFVSWPEITSCLVATEQHSLDKGGNDEFLSWVSKMNEKTG